jgi:hypothetical protein
MVIIPLVEEERASSTRGRRRRAESGFPGRRYGTGGRSGEMCCNQAYLRYVASAMRQCLAAGPGNAGRVGAALALGGDSVPPLV